MDLYCGSGGITLALADSIDRVVGVDTNREGIEDAKKNAERNGISNAEFVCEDALEFLKKLFEMLKNSQILHFLNLTTLLNFI